MVGGRRDRGLYDGRNMSGARIWLEVGADRGLYGGGNVSGARMWLVVGERESNIYIYIYIHNVFCLSYYQPVSWLEVGDTEDSTMDCQSVKPGCGWRLERQRTV